MTTPIADYPEDAKSVANSASGHDLDPTNGDGDLVLGPLPAGKLQAIFISVNSTSGENVSASIEWQDENGNTVQNESATDLAMSGVTEDWARAVRKGDKAVITVTSEVAGGTANVVNCYVGGHR